MVSSGRSSSCDRNSGSIYDCLLGSGTFRSGRPGRCRPRRMVMELVFVAILIFVIAASAIKDWLEEHFK